MRSKEAAEPETTTCKGSETLVTKADAYLGKCIDCGVFNSHSEIDHLCLGCHNAAADLEFDEDKKRFVKKTKGRK